MNNTIGLISISLGTLLIITGILLVIVELITGRHAGGGPRGRQFAGLNWQGMTAFVNALKALFAVLGDWPALYWLFLLGLIFFVGGVWILVARPILG